jgi:outer membrane protein assembly factor BamB
MNRVFSILVIASVFIPTVGCNKPFVDAAAPQSDSAPAAEKRAAAKPDASPASLPSGDYTQWGGENHKNNVRGGKDIPTEWSVGKVDPRTGERRPGTTQNIKWIAKLGSQTYANPIIVDGKMLIGTNNGAGWLPRYPADVDLGVMLCFQESDAKFLWQYSAEKLPTGKVHDWELLGICSTPVVEDDRAWFVDNRGQVVCVDIEGFHDGEDDGPVTGEWAKLFELRRNEDPAKDTVGPLMAALAKGQLPPALAEEFGKVDDKIPGEVTVKEEKPTAAWSFATKTARGESKYRLRIEGPRLVGYRQITTADKNEADVIWVLDMMKTLGASQHNAASCSGVIFGDILFMGTSNGVDAGHANIPAPNAPSFLALDKNTGKILWSDKSPGLNILHGQWSSPAFGVLGGVPQVLFAGGDGWLYSFLGEKTDDGKAKLLWKFDCNPKDSLYEIRGLGTRNHIIGTPVIYDGKVYIAVGEDPEHGDGVGHLWCIDPTKRGDVSSELAMSREELAKPVAERTPLPHKRIQAIDKAKGEVAVPNPNSAMVWHYAASDLDGDKKIDPYLETMHRSIGTVAIHNDLLYIADFSGIFHCLDAKTGKLHWTHDMLSATWGSPLIVEDKVYVGDEDGDLCIFKLSKEKDLINEINMGSSVLGTPIVANNVLYIFNKNALFAIENAKQAKK